MIKSELVEKLADENPHLLQRDIERIVGTIFEEITMAISSGNRVELRGGRFRYDGARRKMKMFFWGFLSKGNVR